MPKAVIFDIDGTLCPGISWSNLTRDLGASVEQHTKIFDAYRSGDIGYEPAKRQLMKMWRRTGRADRGRIARIFEGWPLDPAARPLIEELQRRGHPVCVITGSFDLYAQIVARRLDVSHYYANTKLEFDASGKLTDFHYTLDQAAKKTEHFNQFCQLQQIRPADCYAVGDDENDIGLFKATGHGILIERTGQSAELKRAAWKTATRLADISPEFFA